MPTKDFIIKNGLQVQSNVVIGTYATVVDPIQDGLIVSGSVGIGTSTVGEHTKLRVVGGNVDISTNGYGIQFPDGSFLKSATDAFGPTGPRGEPGTGGSAGDPGADGQDGATGPTGYTGPAGNDASITVSLITMTGPTGVTSNAVSNVSTLRFDSDAGFDVTDLGAGEVMIGMNSTFKYWEIDGQDTLVANGIDHIHLIAGNNITLTSNVIASPKSLTISADSATVGGSNGAVQYNNNGVFSGDSSNFFYDPATHRLGIGTSDTSAAALYVKGNVPSLFNTQSSGDPQIIVGNSITTGATVGYNPSSEYGYLKPSPSGTSMLIWNSTGIGLNGVTPANTLDISGGAVIGGGASYAGSATAPSNGLLVQGAVGLGTTSPGSMKLKVVGTSTFSGNVGIGTTSTTGITAGNVFAVFGSQQLADSLYAQNNIFSNAIISGTTGFQGGYLNGSDINASGAAVVNSLTSNVYGMFGQNVSVNSSNASTSKTSGALVVVGGVGIGGDLNVGPSITVDNGLYGNVVITQFASVFGAAAGANPYSIMQVRSTDGTGMGMNAYGTSLYSSGALNFRTGATIKDKDYATGGTTGVIVADNGNLLVLNGAVSNSTSNGALVVTGGAGISGALNVGGQVFVGSLNSAGTATVNSLTSNGTIGGTTITGTGFQGGYFHGSDINASGAAVVSSLSSNATITAGTGLTVTTGGATITGTSSFTGNVTITGNLILGGSSFITSSNVLVVNNPMIYLAEDNPADIMDIGIIGSYNEGNYYHTGLVRNHLDNNWTLFDSLITEPTTTVNWSDSSLTYAGLKAGNITVVGGTLSVNSTTGALKVTGGVGISGALNVGGQVYSASMNSAGTATVNSLISNGTITGTTFGGTTITGSTGFQGGYFHGSDINASGDAVVNSLSSNSTVSGTTITGSTGFQGGYFHGSDINASSAAVVNSLSSNGTVSGTTITGSTGFQGGYFHGSDINASGAAVVNSLSSNGAVSGTTISGSTGFQGGYFHGSDINASGAAVVNSLTSNGAISGTTFGGTLITASTGFQGGYFHGSDINASGAAVVNSLTSNVYGLFGQNVTISSANVGISTTTGALVVAGGAGIGGNLYVGGNIITSGSSGNISGVNNISTLTINVSATTDSTSTITGAIITAGGIGVGGAINVGGQVFAASVNSAGTATVNSLVSNGTVSGTTITGSTGFQGGYFNGASLNTSGAAVVSSLTSNVYGLFGQNITVNSSNASTSTTTGAIVTSGGVGVGGAINVGGQVFAASMNSAGTATVSSLVSNGVISGTTTTVTSLQSSGTATVSSLVSNGVISGTTATVTALQSSGTATVASLVSNGAISGTTATVTALQSSGTATVSSLVSNGAISGTTTTVTSLQSSGTATVNSLTSNVYGLFGQNITVNSSNASTSTTTGAIVTSGGVGVAGAINAGGQVFSASTMNSTGQAIHSSIVSNVYGLFGQNVTVNSSNASTGTTTGALIVGGGVGAAGNLNVGGTVSIFSGNVGIGTSAAVSRLSVVGGSPLGQAGDTYGSTSAATFTSPNYTFGTTLNPATLQVMSNGVVSDADGGGTIGIGGRYSGNQHVHFAMIKAGKGSVFDGQYSGYLAFGTTAVGSSNISEKMRIDTTGNVGIGTTLPTSTLHVVGNANIFASTASTSTTTGAIVTAGGIGLAGNVYAGGSLTGNSFVLSGTAEGGFIYTSAATGSQAIDTFATATYRAAEYQISINSGSVYSITKVTVIHDGTTAYVTEYDTMTTGALLATFDSSITSGTLSLNASPLNAATTFKIYRRLWNV